MAARTAAKRQGAMQRDEPGRDEAMPALSSMRKTRQLVEITKAAQHSNGSRAAIACIRRAYSGSRPTITGRIACR